MQIQLTSDPTSGQGGPASRDGAGLDLFDGEKELIDDFLNRLQSIIRRAPAPAASLDDTRPSGLRQRARL